MMAKRSDFPRRKNDAYDTWDRNPVAKVIPFLRGIKTFAEPCAGNGALIEHLHHFGLECRFRGDIEAGVDALSLSNYGRIDAIITNPPWTREILHELIDHFQNIAPTWLLFDADWAFTNQAAPYLDQCSHFVNAGRVKWIPESKHCGKDNAAWYRFHSQHEGGPRFYNSIQRSAS